MGLGPVGARSPALISGPKLYFSKLESKSTEIEHKISQKKNKTGRPKPANLGGRKLLD